MDDSFNVVVGHRTSVESAGGAPSGFISGPGYMSFRHNYKMANIVVRNDGEKVEHIHCPECGQLAFELRRETALYTTWVDSPPDLQDWLWKKFQEDQIPHAMSIASGVVFVLAIGVLTWIAWEAWLFIQAHGWSEFMSSDADGGKVVVFALSVLLALISLGGMFVSSGSIERQYIASGEVPPDTVFWIAAKSGAPIKNDPRTSMKAATLQVVTVTEGKTGEHTILDKDELGSFINHGDFLERIGLPAVNWFYWDPLKER